MNVEQGEWIRSFSVLQDRSSLPVFEILFTNVSIFAALAEITHLEW